MSGLQLKRYDRYLIDFKGKWVTRCASLLGISLFIRVVYFFGLMNVTQCSTAEVLFDMVLAMGLTIVFLVFFSAMKRNAPGLYAILGAVFLVLTMITTFSSGDALRIVLAVLGYGAAAAALIATVSGYLPGRLLSSLLILIPLVVRLFCFDLGNLGLFQWVLEISWLLLLGSLFCLTRALKAIKHRG